jgi:hypothetical protein
VTIDVLTCTVDLEEVARILIAHVVSVKRDSGLEASLRKQRVRGNLTSQKELLAIDSKETNQTGQGAFDNANQPSHEPDFFHEIHISIYLQQGDIPLMEG